MRNGKSRERNPTSTTDYDDLGELLYDGDIGGGGENMEGIINISTQSSDIYKVQPMHNRSLKSLALNILKYLPEDILREEPDFLSIKSNDTIQDCEACQECDKPILTEDPPRSLVLNICGNIVHQTCDDRDPSLFSEDVDEENNEDGEVESTLPEGTNSAFF